MLFHFCEGCYVFACVIFAWCVLNGVVSFLCGVLCFVMCDFCVGANFCVVHYFGIADKKMKSLCFFLWRSGA